MFGEELDMKFQTRPIKTKSFSSVNLVISDIEFLKVSNVCIANSKIRGEHQVPHILVALFSRIDDEPYFWDGAPTGLQIARTYF